MIQKLISFLLFISLVSCASAATNISAYKFNEEKVIKWKDGSQTEVQHLFNAN